MDISKKGLGRGLSSLMGETEVADVKPQTISGDVTIAISKLKPSSIQPRRLFDKNSINIFIMAISIHNLFPIKVYKSNSKKQLLFFKTKIYTGQHCKIIIL